MAKKRRYAMFAKKKRKPVRSPKRPVLNKQGGTQPRTSFELVRARAVDLVTLPTSISGTNCSNCLHFKNGFCKHKLVQMPVTKRQCCALWNAPHTLRATKVV